VIYKFLQHKDFEELREHELTEYDWEALGAFLDILSVCVILQIIKVYSSFLNSLLQKDSA